MSSLSVEVIHELPLPDTSNFYSPIKLSSKSETSTWIVESVIIQIEKLLIEPLTVSFA